MKPRAELSAADRTVLIEAFERVVREIPTVRGVRVGRRVKYGAGYESIAPDARQTNPGLIDEYRRPRGAGAEQC